MRYLITMLSIPLLFIHGEYGNCTFLYFRNMYVICLSWWLIQLNKIRNSKRMFTSPYKFGQ